MSVLILRRAIHLTGEFLPRFSLEVPCAAVDPLDRLLMSTPEDKSDHEDDQEKHEELEIPKTMQRKPQRNRRGLFITRCIKTLHEWFTERDISQSQKSDHEQAIQKMHARRPLDAAIFLARFDLIIGIQRGRSSTMRRDTG
jgi:hypothetical protein